MGILLLGFFEVIGIASVLPFMELLSKEDALQSSRLLTKLYNGIDFGSYRNFVIAIGSFILFTIAFSNILGALIHYFQLKFSWNFAHKTSAGLLKVYGNKPYSFYLRENTSNLRAYLLNEVVALTSGVIIPIIEFISRAVVCIIILCLLLTVSVMATLTMGGILGGAYGLIYLGRQKMLRRLGKEKIQANTGRFKYLEEMLSGIKTVKTYGAQKFFYDRFEKESRHFSVIQPKVQMTYATPKYILEILAMGGVLGITMYFFVTSGNLINHLPRLSLYAIAGYRLLPALQNAFSALAKVKHSMPSLDKLYDDLLLIKETKEFEDANVSKMSFSEKIRFDKVDFSYEGSEAKVLKNLNIQINKGEVVAFVGVTGSGKTTIIDIITGLLTPVKGKVLIDSKELTPTSAASWQQNIAYVPQDVYLYDDSVKSNITFGIENREGQGTVESALKLAGIDQFVLNELPDGMDTLIGERGVRLSGGQKQRLGLARALYKQPSVLILDEATSALDNLTEKEIIDSLVSLPGRITIIMIAHRLSSVRFADRIFLVEDGSIASTGTYNDLIDNNQTFKKMEGVINQEVVRVTDIQRGLSNNAE